MDIAFLIVRLIVGLALAAHGAQKLFGWFGGPGLRGTAGALKTSAFVPESCLRGWPASARPAAACSRS